MELVYDHLTRQMDIIPVEVLGTPINIIGAGALGSFTALQLAKMGFANIKVWDHDEVSVENMSNQFFRHRDIGTSKVVALHQIVNDFANIELTIFPRKWTEADAMSMQGIVLSLVDDMQVRKEIFTATRDKGFRTTHLVDARMGAEVAAMYTINPRDSKDQDMYEKTLYSNEEAVQERCTAKSTMYTVNILTGLVARSVKNIACKQPYTRTLQWDLSLAHSNPAAGNLLAYSGGLCI